MLSIVVTVSVTVSVTVVAVADHVLIAGFRNKIDSGVPLSRYSRVVLSGRDHRVNLGIKLNKFSFKYHAPLRNL